MASFCTKTASVKRLRVRTRNRLRLKKSSFALALIGDYNIKLGKLKQFLDEHGDKTKVTIRFRGREMAHKELGMDLLKRVEDRFGGIRLGRAVSEIRGPSDGDGSRADQK